MFGLWFFDGGGGWGVEGTYDRIYDVFQFTHFPCDDWENMSYYHHQIGTI